MIRLILSGVWAVCGALGAYQNNGFFEKGAFMVGFGIFSGAIFMSIYISIFEDKK